MAAREQHLQVPIKMPSLEIPRDSGRSRPEHRGLSGRSRRRGVERYGFSTSRLGLYRAVRHKEYKTSDWKPFAIYLGSQRAGRMPGLSKRRTIEDTVPRFSQHVRYIESIPLR
jgi:hypothetical protein